MPRQGHPGAEGNFDMQQMIDAIGGPQAIRQMASELGIDEQAAAKGAAALLPMVMDGFQRQANGPAGAPGAAQAGGLGALLGQLGGGSLLDAVLAPRPTPVDQGNQVLGQIFGSNDVSREVADRAATEAGVGPDILRRMLPMIAMAAAGMMARQAGAGQGAGAPAGQGGGMLGQVLGGLMGGQGRGAAGGNPLEDILRAMNQRR
jgi:hypothetical protein